MGGEVEFPCYEVHGSENGRDEGYRERMRRELMYHHRQHVNREHRMWGHAMRDFGFRRSQERFDENKDGVEDEPVDWKIQEPQILMQAVPLFVDKFGEGYD